MFARWLVPKIGTQPAITKIKRAKTITQMIQVPTNQPKQAHSQHTKHPNGTRTQTDKRGIH